MAQYFLARTASFFQGISEYGESVGVESARWQVPLVIGGLSKTDHAGVTPFEHRVVEGGESERVAEDVTKQVTLHGLDGKLDRPTVIPPVPSRPGGEYTLQSGPFRCHG
jgi:hypothetical protein